MCACTKHIFIFIESFNFLKYSYVASLFFFLIMLLIWFIDCFYTIHITNFENNQFAKDVLKKFQPNLFCQSCDNWGQSWPETDRQIFWHHILGYVNFFFQLNLLPLYCFARRGIKANILALNQNVLSLVDKFRFKL